MFSDKMNSANFEDGRRGRGEKSKRGGRRRGRRKRRGKGSKSTVAAFWSTNDP